MIVPKSRLIFWSGVIFLPFTVLMALVPNFIMLSIGLIVCFVVLVLVDAMAAYEQLDGIRVQLPGVIRLSKGKGGKFELRIKNTKNKTGTYRIGLPLPMDIEVDERDYTIEIPEETPALFFKWPCKALRQGKFLLQQSYIEGYSPMGFWSVRRTQKVQSEIRVYPNLFIEQKKLTALFMNRGLGIHTQRQVGKGRDFEQLREYLPGDSFDDIHWKATAKHSMAITKVFQIERTQEVYVIIDASRLSARTIDDGNNDPQGGRVLRTTILERFITAALVMGLAAEKQGDLFGVSVFDDRIRGFLQARNGKNHYNACRDLLYTIEPNNISPDFSELITFIETRIRRRALLVFLTNLDDPVISEGFTKDIDLIGRRHLLMVNMLRPKNADPIFSGVPVLKTDDLYQRLGGHFLYSKLRETETFLQRHGIMFSLLENENLCTELISKYLTIKKRQIL